MEHEYTRGGAWAYLAAWDVHRAKLFGRLESTTGIEPFGRLVDQVMAVEPYRSADRVFWVVDNGSSHRGQEPPRTGSRWRTRTPSWCTCPSMPVWLNQIEIYFSILQRKVLTPADALSLADLAANILAFEAGYQEMAAPFEWKFTRATLMLS